VSDSARFDGIRLMLGLPTRRRVERGSARMAVTLGRASRGEIFGFVGDLLEPPNFGFEALALRAERP
jgi:hypothetical protein